jgi:hypothetical protein
MKTILIGSIFLFVSLSGFASGIDGNWAAHMKAPDGTEMEISFVFKTDSAKLTGVVKLPNGDFEISNSNINGKDFSFEISYNDTTITSNCTLNEDDTINMKVVNSPMGELEMILKRQK